MGAQGEAARGWRDLARGVARRWRLDRAIVVLRVARKVDRPMAFAARELRLVPGGPRAYRLRGCGRSVVVRHRTRDVDMLNEIFVDGLYEPPPEVRAALDGAWDAPRVLDLGGNVGLFGVFALGHLAARSVMSFEPDPENLAMLRDCVAANAGAGEWTAVGAAASASEGTLAFVPGLEAESHAADDSERDGLIEVPAQDVLPHFAAADLVKMDIEGGEWAVLQDPRLHDSAARAIVLEHHGRHSPSDDPCGAARELLERAGYTVRSVHANEAGLGMMWAWRPTS